MASPDKGTVVDNTVREKTADGATVDTQTGKGTQWYDDGYRFTRDPREGKDNHWTNQGAGKGDSDRHTPPPDAKS